MAAKTLHFALVTWGALEILLFGGLIFGWASLVYVLKLEGYFTEICRADLSPDNVSIADTLGATPTTTGSGAAVGGYGIIDNGNDGNTASAFDVLLAKSPAVFRNSTDTPLDQLSEGVTSCSPQDKEFNLVYTLATVINGISLFINGILMDKYGTRLCRVLGIATYVTGTLMAAFSTPSTSVLLYPSMILIALGGYYFLMTNLQLGNILPSKRATIISLYCGAYDSSAFILLLIKFAYEGGVSLQTSFLLLTALLSIVVISTFWFMPIMRFPHPIPDGYRVPLRCSCRKDPPAQNPETPTQGAEVELNGKSPASEKELLNGSTTCDNNEEPPLTVIKLMPRNAPTFFSLVATPLFIWDLVWLTCHRFASWSFVGRLNPALNKLARYDKGVVSQYTSVYAALQFFGIFLAPLSGRLMDRRRKFDADVPQNQRLDKLEVCIASFVLDSTIGMLLAITVSIPIMEVQYVSFLLHVIHRACLYGPNSAFIAQAFPMEHFGKMFGLAMSFAAAFSMLQYPIFIMIEGPLNGNPLTANLFTLILMVLSYGHPIYIWLYCRRQRKQDLANRDAIFKPTSPLTLEASSLMNHPESTQ